MKIISTNIGEKKEILWKGKSVITGIFKKPTKTPIFLNFTDVNDDVVVDRRYHGGINKAVYAYGYQHYAYWKKRYPTLAFSYGMFGENLTIDELDETKIFIGDVFKVGEAVIEVTQPREPCMKLGVRFNDMKMVKQFWETDKCGVYFKILEPGFVQEQDTFQLLSSKATQQTIAQIYETKK